MIKGYNYKQTYTKNLKDEYKIGGKNRQYILDKAVDYITSKNLRLGTQGDRHHFLLDKVGLTETEYLECLNKATNGAFVREAVQ